MSLAPTPARSGVRQCSEHEGRQLVCFWFRLVSLRREERVKFQFLPSGCHFTQQFSTHDSLWGHDLQSK